MRDGGREIRSLSRLPATLCRALLVTLVLPLVAGLWASGVAPAPVVVPLAVAAALLLLNDVRCAARAERLANRLCGGDPAAPLPIEHSLARLAERIDAMAHRASFLHPISGLPTREHLFGEIGSDIADGCGPRLLGTLRFADYDRLAAFDQAAANHALAQLAERLSSATRADHVVAQVDRDCFAIWFRGGLDPETAIAEFRAITYMVMQELPSGASVLTPTIEAGMATHPQDGDEAVPLLTRALVCLARPRVERGGDIQLVRPPSLEESRERFALEQDLAQAIAEEQLTMCFQPLVDLAAGRIVGAEALLRWDHPRLGAVSPARFIPIVEAIGLSDRFGAWVLNTACRETRRWQEGGLTGLRTAVNLSACQLMDPDLRDKIERTLGRHGLDPSALELELTETAAMADAARTLRLFGELHAMGINLAIDDFGSGHSSLSYLKNLPFDKLKIDREFVTQVHERRDSQAICRALVELGRGLGLRVLAEGVESRDEVDTLARLGCTLFQGYYFAKPMTSEAFVRFAADPRAVPGLGSPVHDALNRLEGRLSA